MKCNVTYQLKYTSSKKYEMHVFTIDNYEYYSLILLVKDNDAVWKYRKHGSVLGIIPDVSALQEEEFFLQSLIWDCPIPLELVQVIHKHKINTGNNKFKFWPRNSTIEIEI